MRLCGLLTSFNLRGPSPQPSHSFRVSRSRGKRASLETQQGEKSSPRRLYTALRTARPPLQAYRPLLSPLPLCSHAGNGPAQRIANK
jgi:hypothetical protein